MSSYQSIEEVFPPLGFPALLQHTGHLAIVRIEARPSTQPLEQDSGARLAVNHEKGFDIGMDSNPTISAAVNTSSHDE